MVHSRLLFSPYNFGFNLSVIMLLRFWYSNYFLPLRSAAGAIVRVRRGVRKGGVRSPILLKICISIVLAKISGTYLSGIADVSYLEYTDSLLLISRSKKDLTIRVSIASDFFSNIDLLLNIDKCVFLP